MSNLLQSHKILFINTLAFTICFACWTLNGVLVTFLIEKGIYNWTVIEAGWLMGIPILSGALTRLPIGILTDKYGGKKVFTWLLFLCSIPLFLIPLANSFWGFAILSLLFGVVGASFAVGIGFTSVWYPKEWQGRALGIFGMGNAGAALTTFLAPSLLNYFSENNPENGWKLLPISYGIVLVLIGIIFIFFTKEKLVQGESKNIKTLLQPLKTVRVWRFGMYYFLVFGCFVAYSQWLLPNFMNVYHTTLVMGGMFATLFSMPSGVIRAFGGYLSDKYGARKVMYWVLGSTMVISFLLMFPKMEIFTTGPGLLSTNNGVVTNIEDNKIKVNDIVYEVTPRTEKQVNNAPVFPVKSSWQEIVVQENQSIKKKELIAKGVTHIKFEANMWVYLILVILIGSSWGIGKAAVYKHIPEYFPNEIGVVGGMVGLIGGLGGFFGPIVFGYLLKSSGLWTSSWFFIFIISTICLIWMHKTIIKAIRKNNPEFTTQIEQK